MDRVKRRYFAVSTLIAIPVAVLMASLATGTDPEFSEFHSNKLPRGVQNAVAHLPAHDPSAIRQVVGKQPESRRTRSIRAGGTSDTARAPSSERRGLFQVLFGSSNDRGSDQSSNQTARAATAAPVPQDVDWDGIPYHNVGRSRTKNSSSSSATGLALPIRPSTAKPLPSGTTTRRQASASTRVIRGGASSRATADSRAALVPPQPPADPDGMPKVQTFSKVQSSRRSKPVAVAQGSPSAARRTSVKSIYGDSKKSQADYDGDDVVDLVPRVSRRIIKPAPSEKSIAKTKPTSSPASTRQMKPKVAAEAAPVAKVAGQARETTSQPAKTPVASKTPATSKTPLDSKQIEAGKNVAKPESQPAPARGPKAKLNPPTAKVAASGVPANIPASPGKPAYTLPVDPATQAVPPPPAYAASGGMSQPAPSGGSASWTKPMLPIVGARAAAQPAISAGDVAADAVSHRAAPHQAARHQAGPFRAGPPAAAFQPIRQPVPQFERRGTPVASTPPATSRFDDFTAKRSQPVGSGVAATPVYRTALAPPSSAQTAANDRPVYQDPYGTRGRDLSPRLSTFGQPAPPTPTLDSPTLQSPKLGLPTAMHRLAPRGIDADRPSVDLNVAGSQSHQASANYPMHPIPFHEANTGHAANTGNAANTGHGATTGRQATTGLPTTAQRHTARDHQNRIVKRSQPTSPTTDNFVDASDNRLRTQAKSVTKMPASGPSIVASELPGIRVVTHGPSAVMIRQNNEYEIRVENRGAIDAHGLLVRALIPDWADIQGQNATVGDVNTQGQKSAEQLTWTIDHLPAGQSETLFVRLMAARSGTYNLDVDWTLLPQRSVAQVQVHEPRLELAIEGPDQVVYGQSQTYKVRVLNPGDGVAPNVVFTLSPNSATPQSQRIGDIPAGKEAQFEVELTAQDLGQLQIQGLAAGDLDLRAEKTKKIVVSAARLEAVLGGPELKYQNTQAVYSLQVQNLGNATSRGVTASLKIPPGMKWLGGIEGAVLKRDRLRWEIAELAPGASRDYQFRCNMASTGSHMIDFQCKGSAAGQAAVAIETNVQSIADLVLTISDPPAPAPIGKDVTYEIVLRNRGSREAKNVNAVAQFSRGIEPQRVEGHSGEVVTGQVLFDAIPRIGAGEEVRLRVIAQAEKGGHHRFRTEVRSGETFLVAEEATHYMSPRSDRVSRRSSDTATSR